MKRLSLIYIFIMIGLLPACSPAAAPRTTAPLYDAKPALGQPEVASAPSMAPVAQATPAPVEGKGQSGPGNTTSPLAFEPAGSSLVIKDAQLDLLVKDTSQALARVTALAGDEGGYIISSQTWYQDGYLYAMLRLGVPSERFEASLNQIRAIGLSVLKENAQGQDVTDQYVDLQSRLTNLEATAARVRDFLKNAKTIEESLRINQQLSELEAQIEQVKGQMHYFEGRAAFSTVTVNLTPEYPTPTPTATPTMTPTPTATPAWNPGTTFNDASGVLSKQFRGFVDALIWVGVVVMPWLLLAILVVLVLRSIFRRSPSKIKPT